MEEQAFEWLQAVGSMVTTVLLPLLGVFMFYDAKKRKENASARKAEAENITSYAAEWKELYEKKERKVMEQDEKIDQLYAEKNEDRQRIRELMEKNTALEIENIKLQARRCDVRGCSGRKPPSDY